MLLYQLIKFSTYIKSLQIIANFEFYELKFLLIRYIRYEFDP